MSTKKKLNSFFLLLLLIFYACNNEEKKHQHSGEYEQLDTVLYSCPMHPEVESTEPGICPKCKMNLELKITVPTLQLLSPNKLVLSRQSTVKLHTTTEAQTVYVQGYIAFDKTRDQSVAARFGGRIEKLFVKYNLQFVKKGEKILELYSPELNTFREEHLFLLKTGTEKNLLEQSKQKLKLLGINEQQIAQLETSGKFSETITIYSPADGYVSFNSETSSNGVSEVMQESSMSNMSTATKNNSEKNFGSANSQIREGTYINKGETIFSVNDLQTVWAIVSVSSDFYSAVKTNTEVKISSELFPDEQLTGKIALVEQTFEENKQRFVRIRIAVPNTNGKLMINSFIKAEIPLETKVGFQIPASAVYRTGLNSFVWLKTDTTATGAGIFKLQKVITGSVTNGETTVIQGLSASDEVAEQAGYLTDSETFLNDN